MKMYRTVIALFVLAALVIPQPTPVQSAPLNAERTINLQPGDSATATCPTILIPKVISQTKLRVLCAPAKFKKGSATPTPMPTATATSTATPTANRPLVLAVAMQPGDIIIVTCPTRMIPKYASRKSGKILCRAAVAASTATATQVSAPTETKSPVSTETQPSSEPTATSTNGSDPIPTFTQTFTGTPTHSQDATATVTVTQAPSTTTPTPTRTPTSPAGGNTQPYAGAPACPSHNPNQWHGLWDAARGCHYDHTHGDDPALANSYFGPAGALWGGQTISHPFATSEHENHMKHGGYKYSVKTPEYHPWPACGINAHTDVSQTGNNCIKASRIQYHVVGGTMDTLARSHSYYMEVLVCQYPAYTECGVIKIGGHADFAQLQSPHYKDRVVRPGGTIDFGDGIVMNFDADGPDLPSRSGEPYVFMIPYSPEELAQRRARPPIPGFTTMDQWSMNDFDCDPRPSGSPCRNQYARFLTQVADAWNLLDKQSPNTVRWICKGEPGCAYNGSMIGVNEVALHVLQTWQPGGNGFVTLTGYTDRWGNPRTDNVCNTVSVDCVPLVLNHVPTGYAATRTNTGCECVVYEYDIYFNGRPSDWIKFPN